MDQTELFKKVKKRKCDECGNEYEYKLRTSKFCSSICRVTYHKKHGLGDVKEEKTTNVKTPIDEPAQRKIALPQPAGMDLQTQYIFNLQNKEIDRFEELYKEERSKRKALKEKLDKAKEELATIKTDQKISQIEQEHAKPSGLQGFTQSVEGFLNNQYIGPVIAQMVAGMFNGAGVGQLPGGDADMQQAAVDVVNWFATQDKDTQDAFKILIDTIGTIHDKAQLPGLIGRLVNVIKGGTSIVKGTATASYGT